MLLQLLLFAVGGLIMLTTGEQQPFHGAMLKNVNAYETKVSVVAAAGAVAS
jgi:hypothetical protein